MFDPTKSPFKVPDYLNSKLRVRINLISSIKIYMQAEDPLAIPDHVYEQISTLSSNEHYFLLYPTDKMLESITYQTKFTKVPIPYVLVFIQNDQAEFKQIAEQFLNENKIAIHLEDIKLTLQQGTVLNEYKMRDLKTELRIQTLDGITIFYDARDRQIKDQAFQPECSQKTVITSESIYNEKAILATFYIAQTKYYFYLPVHDTANKDSKQIFNSLLKQISEEIYKIYGDEISIEDIVLTVNYKGIYMELHSSNMYLISKQLKIVITFKKEVELDCLLPFQPKNCIIFQGEGIAPISFIYEQISQTKVGTILKDILGFGTQKINISEYGLRIFEVVIKSCEKLSQFPEIRGLLSNLNTCFKFIHAKIIKESSVFSVHQTEIAKLPYFNMETIIDTSDKKNTEHRELCRQRMQSRADKINIAHFKDVNNIEPIFLYTSELKVKQNKRSSTLYNSVNTFLRSQIFGQVERKDYEKWQYLFTNKLLNQLKQAPQHTGTLYRGIKYSSKHKVGDIVEYKQFSSSSTNKEIALNFAEIGLVQFNNYTRGRSIAELSFYQKEEEVIIMPYSRFRVTKITQNVPNIVLKCQIDTIEMEAIPDDDLPEPTCVIVLWVDDKSGPKSESYQICKKFSLSNTNTFINHFKSTASLQQFLKTKNGTFFSDPTIQIALISNMARVQTDRKNETAGIDALKLFRSYLPNSHVFFYVGYLPATIDNLKKNNFQLSNTLQVSNNIRDLFRFFDKIIKIL